jgi:chitinase
MPGPAPTPGRPVDAATAPDTGSSPDAGPGVGPSAPPPPPFREPGIVVYWGQNGYSARTTNPNEYEKDLSTTCQENPHYEAIVLAFVTEARSPANADGTPRTNFSKHCNSMNAFDAAHPRLYRCDAIGRGVNDCQRLGKKVLLSLGGATGMFVFPNDGEAQTFAQTTWDMFLNGKHQYRPFGTAVLDGIDLDIEGGGRAGYAAYVRRLRELMNADKSRKYYVTGAPQCPFPDAHLGPSPGSALGDVPQLFDYLFVQFYNNFCGGQNPSFLLSTFNQWSRVGPKIMLGLPARPEAGGGFTTRAALPGILNMVRSNPAFAGIMLWDVSYDQNSVENGQTYGAFAKSQLR